MRTYVGWVPTTVGRLSFSSIGDTYRSSSVIFNAGSSSPERRIFGVTSRRSTWLPGFVTRFWHHYPTTAFAIFLSLSAGKIAVPSDDGKCSHALKREPDAALSGKIYFLNGWGITRGRSPRTHLRGVRFAALRAEGRADLPQLGDELWERLRDRTEASWQLEMQSIVDAEFPSDLLIGVANVELLRSGECRVSISPEEHSLLRWAKTSALSEQWGGEVFDQIEREILQETAQNVFDVVRNLAHKHYHHKGDAPSSSALTEWSDGDDRRWRNATMHALLRTVVAFRRADTADGYRRALGVLAYADSFQRHLATWSNERGSAVKIKDRMSYDLSALKASIEASLKVRELSDQGTRGRMLFAFGTLITAITLISPTLREYLPDVSTSAVPTRAQAWLVDSLSWMVANPIPSLLIATFAGISADWLFTRIAFNRDISNIAATSAQAMDVTLAWMSDKLKLGSRLTQILVIVLIALGLVAVSAMWLEIANQAGVKIALADIFHL